MKPITNKHYSIMNEINLHEMSLTSLIALQRRIGLELADRKKPPVSELTKRYRLMCDKMSEIVHMDVSEPGRECNRPFWRAMVITALLNEGYRGTDIENYTNVTHCMAVNYRRMILRMLSAPVSYKRETAIWNKFTKMIGYEDGSKGSYSDFA